MARYILLRDETGNWRGPQDTSGQAIAPRDPRPPAAPRIEIAELSPTDLRAARADPVLLEVQPAMPTRLIAPVPMDELRDADVQPGWGLEAMGAGRSPWDGAGVTVALLDTGIETGHPAFAGTEPVLRDFSGTGAEDANGHGTHVAATVLGREMGGRRIGVAPGATLLAGKALPDTGRGRSEDFLRALLWAQQQEPDVVGFALDFDTAAHVEALTSEDYPPALALSAALHARDGNRRICEILIRMCGKDRAPLILGAVGNDSLRVVAREFETGPAAPAAARGVLAIGACGPGDTGLIPAAFGNSGAALTAPGVGILSASPGGGLRALNGSSMAMAHAAGAAALWIEAMRSRGATVTAQSVATRLLQSATLAPFGPLASPLDCGHGLVQAPA